MRQAIFDVLGQRFPGGEVLDLYAGTGALGLEALSRGAARARLVDRSAESLDLCRRNAQALGLAERVEVLRRDLPAGVEGLAPRAADWLFADPPYGEDVAKLLRVVAASGILAPGGVAIVEHERRSLPGDRYDAPCPLEKIDERRFGDTLVSFYRTGG